MRKLLWVLASSALTVGAVAQTIGNYPLSVNSSTVNLPQPNTVVDFNSGATSAGSIATVVIRTNSSDCPGDAFKVKFFRRSGNTLTMTAERGPFPVTSSLTKVTLSPPVAVLQGDLLGITELKSCAGTVGLITSLFKNAYHFEGDVTSASITAATWLPNFELAAFGADAATTQVRTQVILGAGAAGGSGGAQFKTDLYLGNLGSNTAAGRLVYHPAGTSGVPTNPSFAFTVGSLRTSVLTNFVGTNLGITGVGSIDVYTTLGFEAATIAARVYDDAGAAGTKGFTFDALTPADALQPFENAILFAPQDTTRFRMNLGIRTLSATEVQFLHLTSTGDSRAFVTKSYPANYFIQGLVSDFTGVTPQSGDQIIVYTTVEPFFAFGSIIDNTNNDPSVQVAKHLK